MAKKKHSFGKSIDIYGQIILRSLKTAWGHPEFWLIGALAGLASTGASSNHLFKSFWRIRPAETITFDTLRQVLDGLPWLATYVKNLLLLGPGRIGLTVLALFILAVAVVILVVGAQQLILISLHRIASRKKQLTLKQLFGALQHWHFWRIFSVDALVYLASMIILALAALVLTPLISGSTALNFVAYLAVYAVLIPLALVINILGMLTLVTIIRKETGLLEAFLHSLKLLRHHWLVAFELSILLFLINGIGTIALFLALILFAALVALLVLSSLGAGSIVLMALITFFGVLGGVFIVVAYGGFMTVFNYGVWIRLAGRLERYGLLPAIEGFFRKK
ncbi:hypothetical protein IH979_00445 [Patescibacteria group bacterium]|nr:hypothetical protein [Patescibacteria group bacterium]